ncbi:MAG: pyroglutamyl-peptidase I [Hyphomicrobiales bacterium]|nr:pyroglutamyl-peptidase I [Hyphomicrobiales bacterium]
MSRPRLLVTGFGPFPGAPRNPTAAVVERLMRRSDIRSRVEVIGRVLPTTWAAVEALPTLLDQIDPDAVLMLGLARRATGFRVEKLARARVATAVDAEGRGGPARLSTEPAALAATAPVRAMHDAIRARGLPAKISTDAGAYLCNGAFRRALEAAAGRPAAFLHLPPTRNLAPSSRLAVTDLERGVAATIPALLAAINRRSR